MKNILIFIITIFVLSFYGCKDDNWTFEVRKCEISYIDMSDSILWIYDTISGAVLFMKYDQNKFKMQLYDFLKLENKPSIMFLYKNEQYVFLEVKYNKL